MVLTQSCHVTVGSEWYYFLYFSLFIARDRLGPSIDPPRGCVNVFLQARYITCYAFARLVVCFP